MNRRFTAIALAALLIGGSCLLALVLELATSFAVSQSAHGIFVEDVVLDPLQLTDLRWVLEEDDPGWDCATMGNHICGKAGN